MGENNYSWHHIVVVVVVVWSALEWLTNTKREKGEKRKKKNCRLLKQSLFSFSFRMQVHSGSTVQYTSAVWRTVSGQRRRLWGNFALPPSHCRFTDAVPPELLLCCACCTTSDHYSWSAYVQQHSSSRQSADFKDALRLLCCVVSCFAFS